MENYETILANLLGFVFDIVNHNNEKILILKYSTYDRFPKELIEHIKQGDIKLSILQSSDTREAKIQRLEELKNNRTSEDVIMLDIHKAGVIIRDAIFELATLQQDIAFRKVQFIESCLNSIDSLDLNPADPEKSFKTFFTNCNNLEFNYIGPDYSSIDKLKITPNLIDDIIEDIINRIRVVDKIKTGLNRAFSIDPIQTTNVGIDRISEKRLNRLDIGLLPEELPLMKWHEINSKSSSNTRTTIPAINESSNYFESEFLNTNGQLIISKLKQEYKNANVNRVKDMLCAMTELNLTDSSVFKKIDMDKDGTKKNEVNMAKLVAALNCTFEKSKPLYNVVSIRAAFTKNSNYDSENQKISNMLL